MIHLPGVLAAAAQIQDFCESKHWRFCFIGGVAVQRWGEPRLTQDVDLTLLTGFGNEEQFTDLLLQTFLPRRPDAREFALNRRVLLARTRNGVDIDIAYGALPFEEQTILRSSVWKWADTAYGLRTCSAEDLVVHKAFAGRDLDWSDVDRILTRQYGNLNLAQVRTDLKPLLELKGELEGLDKLEQKIKAVAHRLRTPDL